jgi:hypothetical protein
MRAMLHLASYFLKQIGITILFVVLVYASACTNNDSERGQFDNNSSGMDQDHTAAPPDTVKLNESTLNDTSQAVQSQSVDSVSKQ